MQPNLLRNFGAGAAVFGSPDFHRGCTSLAAMPKGRISKRGVGGWVVPNSHHVCFLHGCDELADPDVEVLVLGPLVADA